MKPARFHDEDRNALEEEDQASNQVPPEQESPGGEPPERAEQGDGEASGADVSD